jgi:hypothetical protein
LIPEYYAKSMLEIFGISNIQASGSMTTSSVSPFSFVTYIFYGAVGRSLEDFFDLVVE